MEKHFRGVAPIAESPWLICHRNPPHRMRQYERARRIFTKRSCGEVAWVLPPADEPPQAQKIPTMAKKLIRVLRCQCRLGYPLGGPARPRGRKTFESGAVTGPQPLLFTRGNCLPGQEKKQRARHVRTKCRHGSVAFVTCPAALYRSGGTPTDGRDAIGRRCHLSRVALVFSSPGLTPRAEK